tara:strand:+ start:434 stop:1285 length:852 start_codon:yes stop_codon:yes gene_type:complete
MSDKFPTNRRDFLKLLGAGITGLVGGKYLKGLKSIDDVTKAVSKIPPVSGMPSWFPALVHKIRIQGKVVKKPDYADFTSGGNTETIYVLKDKSLPNGELTLYEDEVTGVVSINGRGDDFQQVSLEYTPGENVVQTNKLGERGVATENPTFEASAQTKSAGQAEEQGGVIGNKDISSELMDQKNINVSEEGTFEAGEHYKGHEGWGDVENVGGVDDLQGGVISWSRLIEEPRDKLKRVVDEFKKSQKNTDTIDDMATGGLVPPQRGPMHSGVGTLFKERKSWPI